MLAISSIMLAIFSGLMAFWAYKEGLSWLAIGINAFASVFNLMAFVAIVY